MLAVPRISEDTSSSELSDVPRSPSTEISVPQSQNSTSKDRRPNAHGEIHTKPSSNISRTESPLIPPLTPATAEILARVNSQSQMEASSDSTRNIQATMSLNSRSQTKPEHLAPMAPSTSNIVGPISNISQIRNPSNSHPKIILTNSPNDGGLNRTGPKLSLKFYKPPLGDSVPSSMKPVNQLRSDAAVSVISNQPRTPAWEPAATSIPEGQMPSSGKGLGRGRPGIKRGPRKRKRDENSESEEAKAKASPSDGSELDNYSPQETQTKSGRQVHRPTSFVPSESPQSAKPKTDVKVLKKKHLPASAKGRDQNILCEHCLRGNGPLGNAIVFCDGCNRAWHQKCHEPRIAKEVVINTEKDWFCTECTLAAATTVKKKQGRPRKLRPEDIPAGGATAQITPNGAFVGAKELTALEQRKYLEGLTKEQLVAKLLKVASENPSMTLFAAPPPAPPIPQPRQSISMSVNATPEDSDDEYIYDEHALLYPKPGCGIRLPPEEEDLDMLLEGPECKTFSHSLRPDVRPVISGVRWGKPGVLVFA